jgi:hypothetical protein
LHACRGPEKRSGWNWPPVIPVFQNGARLYISKEQWDQQSVPETASDQNGNDPVDDALVDCFAPDTLMILFLKKLF